MQFRNPRFTPFETIECELQFEAEGPWLPFHVVPAESAEMAALDAQIRASGNIAPHVPPVALKPDPERNLTAAQFEWLLAFTGLDDVWDNLLTATKNTDRETFAMLKAQRAQPLFHLAKVLANIATLNRITEQIAPDIDLSEARIKAAWAKALEVSL